MILWSFDSRSLPQATCSLFQSTWWVPQPPQQLAFRCPLSDLCMKKQPCLLPAFLLMFFIFTLLLSFPAISIHDNRPISIWPWVKSELNLFLLCRDYKHIGRELSQSFWESPGSDLLNYFLTCIRHRCQTGSQRQRGAMILIRWHREILLWGTRCLKKTRLFWNVNDQRPYVAQSESGRLSHLVDLPFTTSI